MGTYLAVASEARICLVAVATAGVDIAADKVVVAMIATVVAMYLQEVAAMVVMVFAIVD